MAVTAPKGVTVVTPSPHDRVARFESVQRWMGAPTPAAAMTSAPAVQFAVLGQLRATRDGAELDLGPRLQRALLAILLTDANRVVPVDRLVDLLWHDEPPAAAMASLQAYVSQLRKALEPERARRAPARVLVTEDPGYVLRVPEDQVDALRFAALVHRAHDELDQRPQQAAETLELALSLWRGEPFAEFAGEPWALPLVARLTEAHDLAEEDQIDAWLALGRHAQAAAELEPLVDARPLRERRWRQLMVATYRCGRQGDALRAYQRCRSVLADELGIEPGAELRRLEAAVLAQDASLDWRPGIPTGPAQVTEPAEAGADNAATELTQQPATVPPVVGRERELGLLEARIAGLSAGAGGAVVLAGEPGAGKTTLAEAATRLAADTEVASVWVRCIDAASTPAYWPWTQLLARCPDARLVQQARRRVAGDVDGDPNDGTRQFQTYEALLAAITQVTQDRPLLVVIDDVQAADESSLTLLQMLAGDLHRLGVLFVLTLRDTEPCLAVDQTLGELLRHPGVERVGVGALEPADLTLLLTRMSGTDPDPQVVVELMRRTGGNPFHATELIRLLGSEHPRGGITAADVRALDVPAGVRDVLLRRVRRLPEDTQSLLTVAAVAGADVDPDLLETVTGLDTEQLLLAIEPAVAAGLITASDTGWAYRFRHPLIQETLAATVRPVERARLHARLGDALEQLATVGDPASSLAQRAYHYLLAGPFGDTNKAIRYARDAAAAALRQGAWRDAVRQLEQALAAITPAVPDATGIRCDILVELGTARRAGGMIREAHAAFETSIDLADQIGDEDRRLAAAVAFCAPSLWGSREWGETCGNLIALLERELALIPDDDLPRRIRIMATLAGELYFDAAVDRGFAYATQALELARKLGHGEELGIAASAYLLSGLVMDCLRDRRQLLDELLSEGAVELTPMVQAVLHAHRLTEHLRYGDLAAFDREYTQTWRLAVNVLGSPELQSQLLAARACRYMLVGDVPRAEDIARQGLQVMKSVNVIWDQPSEFVLTSALMLVGQTLVEHAEDLLATASEPQHPSLPHLAAPAAALAFALRGDLDRSREITAHWFAPPPRSWSRIQALAYWAQVAILTGQPDLEWLYSRLAPHAGELAIVGVGVDCGGAVDSLLAGVAWRRGDLERALQHAETGLALERRVGSSIWIRRTTQLLDQIRADIQSGKPASVPAPRSPSRARDARSPRP